MTKTRQGFVSLVGAGPGDPELITLKGRRRIEEAEIIVHDRLVSEEILNLAPVHAVRVYAGKAKDKHELPQEEINAPIVRLAREGKRVVRLKGGDPFIFGRGGEEAEALADAAIPYEVVPGVSAAIGCAAELGIPLTHRGLATGVRFLTGHVRRDEPLQLDWKGLADAKTTLAIYMGLSNLDVLTENLLQHGMAPDTPAIAIQEGTTPRRRVVRAPLSDIYSQVIEAGMTSPVLVVVGSVVGITKI